MDIFNIIKTKAELALEVMELVSTKSGQFDVSFSGRYEELVRTATS